MPALPAMNAQPPGIRTGLSDPRSWSWALSVRQRDGANRDVSFSAGDSLSTASLPS